MNLRIADTFTSSLARLTGDEQKSVKTTAFDLQMNPDNSGMSFHRLDKGKDKNFWSVRVNSDIRLIVHKSQDSLLLCYVDHHDKAYAWGERRKLETHPKTGAAQLVEVRETVQEIMVPVYVETPQAAAPPKVLFAHLSEEELLGYGVPAEWLADVLEATEESLLALADHLPGEAAEALLELATGGKPQPSQPADSATNPFEHPDAQRRFRVMTNIEELQRALEFPWDKWMVFLHPAQQEWVERSYSGPARVAGSAGTGKTIVALHRAVFLARQHPDARVLLTTLSDVLANALQANLRRLVSSEPRLAERIEVHSIDVIGGRLYKAYFGKLKLADNALIKELMREASQSVPDHKFSLAFLMAEWEQVVDAWQLDTWESYRDVARLGRKTRLPEQPRAVLWSIFERVRDALKSRNVMTQSAMFGRLTEEIRQSENPPFDFVVVDEAQDISIAHLSFFAAMGGKRRDALFFAGDQGQRILQQPFSWYSLGVDIRGRSRTLRVNYRTSHQIRMQADRLLEPQVADADGNVENRSDTISVFNGPAPDIHVLADEDEEIQSVADWLTAHIKSGVTPGECGVFVRSKAELKRATAAVKKAGLSYKILDDNVAPDSGHVSVATMHLAKGLEFRVVAVMACDDEIVPSQERIETVTDEADLQEVYDTERHLLYVACTRARDHLLVSSVKPASEFLDDLRS
jgi:mRNA-degrading endonuclease RelE of RelBE toxin-antitoxin system